MRARSEATTIRHLRTVLRHARTGLRLAEDPAISQEYRAHFAHDVIRMIDEELTPRRGWRARKRP